MGLRAADPMHKNGPLIDAETFWLPLLVEVVSGAVFAALIYGVLEMRLHLRSDRKRRETTAAEILRAVSNELQYNASVAERLLEHLPEGSLPYARFETNGWELIRQVAGLSALSEKTVTALLETYARTRSANEQHGLLLDLTYGATGAVVSMIAASSPDNGQASFTRYEKHRQDLRDRLLRRAEDLKEKLPETRKLVEDELAEHR